MEKCIFLVACISSLSIAAYHGPLHFPVIGKNGVPVDTPEVRAARRNHLAALASAGDGGYGYDDGENQDGVRQGLNEIPRASKAHHFAPLRKVDYSNGYFSSDSGFASRNYYGDESGFPGNRNYWNNESPSKQRYSGPKHKPVVTKNGYLQDTPEVRAARAQHLKALATAENQGRRQRPFGGYDNDNEQEVNSRNGYFDEETQAGRAGNGLGDYLNFRGYEGEDNQREDGLDNDQLRQGSLGFLPRDTPEVQAAKERHFAAVRDANLRGGFGGDF